MSTGQMAGLPTTTRAPAREHGAQHNRITVASAAALLWAIGYAVINATAGLASNAQLWWQVRQGELTLSTGHAVLHSSWSWTSGDVSWIPNSWGWGVLLAAAYRAGGAAGVAAFALLAQLGVLWLLWLVLGRLGVGSRSMRLVALVVFSLSMSGWADGQSELADYAAVFAFAAVCLSPHVQRLDGWARGGTLAVTAFAIAALWENLHLGGLVSIVAFVAVAVLCTPRRVVRDLLLVAAGAGLGVLATPAGASGLAKSLDTATKSEAEHYAAWDALFAQPHAYNYEPAILALAIGVVALVLVMRRGDWIAAGILVLAAVATCLVVRSGSDLVMLSMIAGGAAVAAWSSSSHPVWFERMPWHAVRRIRIGVVAAAIAWVVVAVTVGATAVTPAWRVFGVDASDLAPIPTGARIFSTIHASDAIDLLRPDLQVTIDSRNDLYPVKEFEFAKSLTGANAAQAPDWFADNDVTAVYLSGAAGRELRTPLAKQLTDAGWHRYPGAHGLVLLSPHTPAR